MTPSPETAASAAEGQTPQPGMEAGPKKKLRVAALEAQRRHGLPALPVPDPPLLGDLLGPGGL